MKLLVLLMAAMLVFVSGCAGQPIPQASTVATDGGTAATSPATSAAPGGKPWPTKSWSTDTPESQGISSSGLAKADERIRDNYPNAYSLLVVRHGYLVYEKYYNGMGQDNANQVYSVTKSVLSALTGIALQQKLISGTGQTVFELLPEYFDEAGDPGKREITIKNVLTMSGGLESIDNDYGPFFSSPDWLAYTLSRPLTDKPGTKFVYNTGLVQCLSDIISKTSGMDARKYANKYLFSELGINAGNWRKDSSGHYAGGTGLCLTPRDMAKFGYLYLNNGQWDGRQIIPQDWVEESTTKQIQASDTNDYGYLFWLETVHDSVKNVDYDTYRADGAGGQKIFVVPDLDIVVVVTADERKKSVNGADTQGIITEYVLPSVQ